MLRQIVLFALVGVALGSAVGGRSMIDMPTVQSREPIDDSDLFDCAGKNGDLNPHPFECTRFLQCHNGRTADKPCPDCAAGDKRCPEGFLNWDQTNSVCNWPDVTPCTPGVRPTDAPAPTTEAPVGDSCDPNDCDVDGDCHGYTWCERVHNSAGPRNDTGVISRGDCGDLYFNPSASAGPVAVCSRWEELDAATQQKYRDDPTCDPYCKLIPDEDCSRNYTYRDPAGNESSRQCPEGTILDVEVRRCVDPCRASASANCPAC